MWPSHGITESGGWINNSLVEQLTEALSRQSLSYFNIWGAVGLWIWNREKLEGIMADAQSGDLFHTLSRTVVLQHLWSWDPNKTYPIKAAQLLIAKKLQKIGLPRDLGEKPDIIWSLGLSEDVANILTEKILEN